MAGKTAKPPTKKMELGTLVHNYLLEPHKYQHVDFKVKKIAASLKSVIGDTLMRYLEPEIAATADFQYEGFTMPWKGRADLAIPGKLIIDLKVINGATIYSTLDYFGYPNQLTGYCLGFDCSTAIIVAYSTLSKGCEVVPIKQNTTWWKEQVVLNGEIL